MKIINVSVGMPRQVEFDGRRVQTSIFKSAVAGKAPVRWENIEGDRQSDLTVHGGRDKAIYVYSHDYYEDWSHELGLQSLETSQFGENLTVSGCRDTDVLIESRYRIGDVEATVTQPRLPCFKLGIRMKDETFPQRFWNRGRLGFYLRVEKEGILGKGDTIELLDRPDHEITVRKLFDIVNEGRTPEEAVKAMDVLSRLDGGWLRRLRSVARKAESTSG